ncbi:hypothetical protein [Leptospira sp. id769339]|uniref:hypothetical protein n=1 Tax=Leptospira sp. id769339 TaxID=2864221 RepID=UPI0012F630A4|nr:hypothetical protein [Leptospira sp. id769339]MCR1793658.1 hypothetical protein [Leptospira sp. id769339]
MCNKTQSDHTSLSNKSACKRITSIYFTIKFLGHFTFTAPDCVTPAVLFLLSSAAITTTPQGAGCKNKNPSARTNVMLAPDSQSCIIYQRN